MSSNRRELLAASLGGAAFVSLADWRCPPQDRKPGTHAVKPLPFDPAKLRGLRA